MNFTHKSWQPAQTKFNVYSITHSVPCGISPISQGKLQNRFLTSEHALVIIYQQDKVIQLELFSCSTLLWKKKKSKLLELISLHTLQHGENSAMSFFSLCLFLFLEIFSHAFSVMKFEPQNSLWIIFVKLD